MIAYLRGTVLGILVLIFIRLVTGNNNRIDRFYGSNARAHFVAVGLGVEIVAFGVGALVEVFLQG